MEPDRPWSVPVWVDEVPEAGLNLHLVADQAARERIARIAGVLALPRLEAEFAVSRRGSGLGVQGAVSAAVVQACVITLEPVENVVSEAVDLVFAPVAEASGPILTHADSDAEPPEPLTDGCVDLGAIATEFLLLGIDPYPRQPGAVFELPASAADKDGPFASLAALKGRRNERRG